MDEVGSNTDFSTEEKFKAALANKVYYGPVYFRRGTEPFMTLAMAGARRDAGVSVAEVNLTHIWDVVNQIRVGQNGRAYVVDAQGRLIAHPEISLVLRNTDFSQLAQVRSARAQAQPPDIEEAQIARDFRGERVLAAHAMAAPLNWLVFVELPESEANAPLYTAIVRTVVVLLAGLVLALLAALLLARLMVVPVRALAAGAARIGAGALDHRITIKSGDELEALGDQLNDMAAKLQSSYATLERKVEERTEQLQAANLSKSRFLAAASHDLRQPLHALNLFAAQLRSEKDQAERDRLAAAHRHRRRQYERAVQRAARHLQARCRRHDRQHLRVSRQQGLEPHRRDVHPGRTRQGPALAHGREQRLGSQRSHPARADPDQSRLQRRALHVGRRDRRRLPPRGGWLRIDVCDSGIGIAADQQRSIFSEFYQVAAPERGSKVGLGLGLAIVERLCAVLDHPIGLASTLGQGISLLDLGAAGAGAHGIDRGSCRFPRCSARPAARQAHRGDRRRRAGARGNGRVAQELGLPRRHCPVGSRGDDQARWERAGPDHFRFPSAGRANRHRRHRELRDAFGGPIPAFLVSGDISQQRLRETHASAHHLLHKPVNPMALRAIMSRLLKD